MEKWAEQEDRIARKALERGRAKGSFFVGLS
jgi:hypothetical protein